MDKAMIEGYGPPDLVARVRNAAWSACVPAGKNFEGLVVGSWVLTDTPDALCPVKFRVTLATVPRGDRLVVEGYQAGAFLDRWQQRAYPPLFTGCCLGEAYVGEVKAYRATIERVA